MEDYWEVSSEDTGGVTIEVCNCNCNCIWGWLGWRYNVILCLFLMDFLLWYIVCHPVISCAAAYVRRLSIHCVCFISWLCSCFSWTAMKMPVYAPSLWRLNETHRWRKRGPGSWTDGRTDGRGVVDVFALTTPFTVVPLARGSHGRPGSFGIAYSLA